jgi:SAM-dependent methyltransferase
LHHGQWDTGEIDIVSDITSVPQPDASFDVVLCTEVLEHVPEPLAVLRGIARVLKPGGRLYLAAPQSWHQHQKPYDFFRYTSFGLRHLLARSGLEVVELSPMGGYFWFMSFQLQMFNYWAFSRVPTPWWRWLWLPLKAVTTLLTQVVLPLVLFYLDPLDRAKDHTLGYVCVAVKLEQAP